MVLPNFKNLETSTSNAGEMEDEDDDDDDGETEQGLLLPNSMAPKSSKAKWTEEEVNPINLQIRG